MAAMSESGWLRRLRYVSVGLHLLFVLAAPFEHHDLICHLKQPLHCTACVSSPLGSGATAIAVVDAEPLRDAGRLHDLLPPSKGTTLAVQLTGRSPPAAS
jgi:hypothetical protein